MSPAAKDDAARVDAYIGAAAPFARPILERIRRAFHQGCPGIEERIKWGHPSFVHHGIVGGMAAFKAHVGFGFWRAKEMNDPADLLGDRRPASAMGTRLTSVKDLPPQRVLVGYVREAAKLNASGERPARPARKPRPEAAVPPALAAALKKNAKARRAFEAFPPSHRREYCEWIAEAKKDDTRAKRVETAIAWIAEGKSRNWKYARRKG